MSLSPHTEPASRVARGFFVACIKCGEPHGVRVLLEEVHRFRCRHCKQEFLLSEVQEMLTGWQAVAAWIEQLPPLR